jgi:signal transduction histidine kinase
LKYGEKKPVLISAAQKAGFIEIKIQDQGRGIAKLDHQRIFQRFERAVKGTEISGLGLGLYIVRQIIELHGGQISIESDLGKGATFVVKLPIAPSLSQPG